MSEDGSEVAFVTYDGESQITKVDKVVSVKTNQPAIVTVKFPELAGWASKLIYADGNKLHALHAGDNVSLFDPLTREFIPLENPQEGLKIIDSAISPNANYIAILLGLGERNKNRIFTKNQTIVKRKLGKVGWKDLFGYEASEQTSRKPTTQRLRRVY